jgi:tetratricopeptide (TPR) repeat protein
MMGLLWARRDYGFAALVSIIMAAVTSCVTPAQKREMDDHIFRLQTRLLQLESNLANSRTADQKTGEVNSKSIASTSSDVERLGIEVKRIKGDIDALKIGVQTGQMPGVEGHQEGSIGAQLAEIRSRLETVENQQKEIINAMDHGGSVAKKGSDKKDSSTDVAGNSDLDSVQAAYKKKKYKDVTELAPSAIGKSKGKDKINLLMIYGESLMKLQRPKEAALQFNELIELKPGEKQMALAKLRLGDAFKAMGDKDTSKLFYDEVATKYAGTPEADKAKKALKSKR